MRWLTWLVLVCGAAAARADANTPAILVLGDSLSAAYGIEQKDGWVALLQNQLTVQRYPHRVINSSISGDTTRGGVQRLPADLARVQPAIVIVELGANDGLRGLPLKTMRANLTQMLTLAQTAGAKTAVLEMRIPPNYGPAYTTEFQTSFTQVTLALKATLVPFFLAPIVQLPESFQDDGIHPTAEVQPPLLDAVWPHLKPLLVRK